MEIVKPDDHALLEIPGGYELWKELEQEMVIYGL